VVQHTGTPPLGSALAWHAQAAQAQRHAWQEAANAIAEGSSAPCASGTKIRRQAASTGSAAPSQVRSGAARVYAVTGGVRLSQGLLIRLPSRSIAERYLAILTLPHECCVVILRI